jgi:hypothetical protein
MSDPEGFLTRWSRRKREAAEEPATVGEEAAAPSVEDAAAAPLPIPPPRAGEAREEAFDPASLPPIDSIGADTDLRPFFAPGVPAQLLHAALRRAWTSDPMIRDFVGLSENAWDFNAGAIPGFGPLDATGEIGRVVANSFDDAGRVLERPAEPPASSTAQPPASTRLSDSADKARQKTGQDEPAATKDETEKIEAVADTSLRPEVDIAVQHKADAPQYTPLPIRRAHGGALPE